MKQLLPPAADVRRRRRSPSVDRALPPKGLLAAVLAGTNLPLLTLLADRALLGEYGSPPPFFSVPCFAGLVSATVVGSAAASWALLRLQGTVRSLRELSSRDELTGLYNRRAGEDRLAEDLSRARRDGGTLAVAILDADGLKRTNDSFGHAAGDAILAHLAASLRRNVREGDWVARWGGDEFVVGLWDAPDASAPRGVLERVARDLRESPVALPSGEKLGVTFSVGLCRAVPEDDPRNLLARADALLYGAKGEGGARIAVES